MGASPTCCNPNVQIDATGSVQADFALSEAILEDSHVACHSKEAAGGDTRLAKAPLATGSVDVKGTQAARAPAEMISAVEPSDEDKQAVNVSSKSTLDAEMCERNGNIQADTSGGAPLNAGASGENDNEDLNPPGEPILAAQESDKKDENCAKVSADASLFLEASDNKKNDGVNGSTEVPVIPEVSSVTDKHVAADIETKSKPKAKPKAQPKQEGKKTKAFPMCYEGAVMHELFPGKKIRLTVQLDSETKGSWTSGPKTLKLKVEWKGDKVVLTDGMTECHGARDSKGNLKGECIQEGTPGGSFEFKQKKGKANKT